MCRPRGLFVRAAHDIIVPDTGCNYYKVEENAENRRGEKKRKERRLVWMIETLVETKISQEFNRFLRKEKEKRKHKN